jgi:hypothetical protein
MRNDKNEETAETDEREAQEKRQAKAADEFLLNDAQAPVSGNHYTLLPLRPFQEQAELRRRTQRCRLHRLVHPVTDTHLPTSYQLH